MFGLIFKLLATCFYITNKKHIQKCPWASIWRWYDDIDSKMQYSYLQARIYLPIDDVLKYSKVILYGVVFPSIYMFGHVHSHVCMHTHAWEVTHMCILWNHWRSHKKNHQWNQMEFLRHFKEWHFTDICWYRLSFNKNTIKTICDNAFAENELLLMATKVSYKKFSGFPGGAVVENLPANAGDTGSSPGLGRSHMPRSN